MSDRRAVDASEVMTKRAAVRWAAAIGVALLVAYGSRTHAEDGAPNAPAPEITVTAPRGLTVGGIAPLLELSPSELESYGADSLSDLVDALKFLTRSSRSDGAPVVLINGHLAGIAEFANLPSDAVERVEVLPETVALQYGFSEISASSISCCASTIAPSRRASRKAPPEHPGRCVPRAIEQRCARHRARELPEQCETPRERSKHRSAR